MLQPLGFQQGLEGLWTPFVKADWAGCETSCNNCGQVCPTGAILPLPIETKKATRIGLAMVNTATCLPHAQKGECQLCVDECRSAGYNAIDFIKVGTHVETGNASDRPTTNPAIGTDPGTRPASNPDPSADPSTGIDPSTGADTAAAPGSATKPSNDTRTGSETRPSTDPAIAADPNAGNEPGSGNAPTPAIDPNGDSNGTIIDGMLAASMPAYASAADCASRDASR